MFQPEESLCQEHKYILILWCKGCRMAMCQKCVTEHSLKHFPKQHQIIELHVLKQNVQKDSHILQLQLQELLAELSPEYDLEEQQKNGLQAINSHQEILVAKINEYFKELCQVLISLTSNHPNLLHKQDLAKQIDQMMLDLEKYKDFQNERLVQDYYERNYWEKFEELKSDTLKFIQLAKVEQKRPELRIRGDILQELDYHLANYISIILVNNPQEIQSKLYEPKQSLLITQERPPRTVQRKQSMFTPISLTQSQVLNRSYIQALEDRVSEESVDEDLKKIVTLEQSKIRYLHCLLDSQRLYLYNLQTKQNQMILLPESADIPNQPQTVLSSDLVFYIAGGIQNNVPVDKFFAFDNKHGLQQLQSLLYPIVHHSLCYLKDALYVIGGKTLEGVTAKCCRYSQKIQKWEPIPNLELARSQHSCCVFEKYLSQSIYVFFGIDDAGQPTNTVEQYDISERKWHTIQIPNMIPGIASLRSATIQLDEKHILIFGGVYTTRKLANKVILFNTQMCMIDNLGEILPGLGRIAGQPTSIGNSVFSMHFCQDHVKSEFIDVLQIVQLNPQQSLIQDIVNCRLLTLTKYRSQN